MIRKTKIIEVEKFVNKINDNYEYREGYKIFGITIRKAGIYRIPIFQSAYLETPNPDYNIIIDNKVYYKPHVRIDIGECNRYKYFDTEKELDIWMDDLASTSKWV